MSLPQDVGMGDGPAQPPVNVDDLRRSGRLAIWPYTVRELPLSPVEALRDKLRYTGHGAAPSSSEEAAGSRHFVEYFPACLPVERHAARREEPGAGTGTDPGALRHRPVPTEQQERSSSAAGGDAVCLMQTGPAIVPKRRETQRRVASCESSPDLSSGRKVRHLRASLPRPRSSSGPRRRPPEYTLAKALSSPRHHTTGDRVECPSGCGDEVRVNDLGLHQASLCSMRFVSCLMPGCPTLVQARLLQKHLREDCAKKKEQGILAKTGKDLHVETACSACNEIMPRKQLRQHLATSCRMRSVQCPSCEEMLQSRSLEHHRRVDCKTAKLSRALNERVANRPSEEECSKCHQMVVRSALRQHTLEECPSRTVACPNRYLGCKEELLASAMALHLRWDCVVRIKRTERAARYASRLCRVQCSGCGYSMAAQHLQRHQREKCPNRRVPCKHWELGCTAMLRLSAMDDHLKVDRLLDPRACLAFDSGRAYIALGEADRKPPWTAEFWIWRPALVEGTREKARTALKALWEFQDARGKLAVTEQRLALLEPLLIDVATRAAKERSEEAEQARDKVTDEMIAAATARDDAKVDLVVSSVVLSNSVVSAARGVEEITAQNKLRGFDRLALGSTPWYAAAPGRSGGGFDRPEGGPRNVGLSMPQDCPPLPPALAVVQADASQTPVDSKEAARTENAPPNAAASDEKTWATEFSATPSEEVAEEPAEAASYAAVDADGVKDDAATGSTDGKQGEDLDTMLLNIAKEQEALEADRQESSRMKEAEFWAEWVALNGPSLAQRILALADKTLPQLKEQVVEITGLSKETLFRRCDDPANDATDEGLSNGEGERDRKAVASSHTSRRRGKNRKAAKKAKRKQKHEENFGKSIEARIADEVGRRGGIESLFGSEKALFQLEMGPNERVGIKVPGKRDQIFNYRCPRERWVHVAFVSNSTGVFLLENGKTASRLRDLSVALPMREIGGRETACQCLVQEVRYWRVKRSKEDLVEWMHQVLPSSAAKDGLVGYWTFEEGRGDYVNDVTEQRFRARKVGGGLKWAVPENISTVNVGAPPTPSWREQNVCKVELRRGRLAQRGRLHRQVVSCPKGCGETFFQRSTKWHLAYRCVLRTVTCSMAACGKRMPAKDVQRHLEEHCFAYGVFLRMAEAGQELQESCSCPHCGETVKRSLLKLHLEHLCHWFKEKCRNPGCAAVIPRLRREEHERRFCGAPGAVQRRRRLARARARSKYRREWAQDGE